MKKYIENNNINKLVIKKYNEIIDLVKTRLNIELKDYTISNIDTKDFAVYLYDIELLNNRNMEIELIGKEKGNNKYEIILSAYMGYTKPNYDINGINTNEVIELCSEKIIIDNDKIITDNISNNIKLFDIIKFNLLREED